MIFSRFILPLSGAAMIGLIVFYLFPAQGAPQLGSLIKGSLSAVYYYGDDGKRYAFPNERIYKSWYADFSGVIKISDTELAAIQLGGNITYRPGVRMVKLATDPKVYAVDGGGTLRSIASESVAKALYGDAWNTQIDDLPEAFFTNYKMGTAIAVPADFSPESARLAYSTISIDRGWVAKESSGEVVDLTQLPLGDGKYSASPKKGYIYSCQTKFNGGGAFANGPWIEGDTWDMTKKISVDGSNTWSNASTEIDRVGATRTIVSNGLPVHGTGNFPVQNSDDAYQYDRNPNRVEKQTITYTFATDPVVNASATCMGGESGISVSGAQIFNGFDAGGRDAVAHEVQDGCNGHPQRTGVYHYHGASPCVATGESELFGYALDGFGIFSNLENGKKLTNDDLDECHGHSHEITWDGNKKGMYHYHLTSEFPYTVGCFRGTPERPATQ